MNRPKICSPIILLLLAATASLGELPPYVYQEQQDKADEAIVIQVRSVTSIETELPNETESAVTVVARVEKVERTKAGLKAGDAIDIHYTRHERKQPTAGPSELPILSKDQTYHAFLNQAGKNQGYVPAAGGHSFDRVR